MISVYQDIRTFDFFIYFFLLDYILNISHQIILEFLSYLIQNFARRALEQFKNLHELQAISIEGDKCQFENSFRYATIKIATMIFKRMAFESRRKAKGVLRPKVRQNYKELSGPWPRTLTEKLLGDMFDCRCAQFLAILQALSDSNRRLILTSPAGSEQEMEILDVTTELFYAAQYILQGKNRSTKENNV
jgi:hypothetical protein